jgi:gluconate kinase
VVRTQSEVTGTEKRNGRARRKESLIIGFFHGDSIEPWANYQKVVGRSKPVLDDRKHSRLGRTTSGVRGNERESKRGVMLAAPLVSVYRSVALCLTTEGPNAV